MRPSNLRNMLCGVCEVADGLISIFTFGNYHMALTFKFLAWAELRDIEKRRKERGNINPMGTE